MRERRFVPPPAPGLAAAVIVRTRTLLGLGHPRGRARLGPSRTWSRTPSSSPWIKSDLVENAVERARSKSDLPRPAVPRPSSKSDLVAPAIARPLDQVGSGRVRGRAHLRPSRTYSPAPREPHPNVSRRFHPGPLSRRAPPAPGDLTPAFHGAFPRSRSPSQALIPQPLLPPAGEWEPTRRDTASTRREPAFPPTEPNPVHPRAASRIPPRPSARPSSYSLAQPRTSSPNRWPSAGGRIHPTVNH